MQIMTKLKIKSDMSRSSNTLFYNIFFYNFFCHVLRKSKYLSANYYQDK